MTLLITVFAAIAVTLVWEKKAENEKYELTGLCLMYWGAALMWLIDGIYEYVEKGTAYFTPGLNEMANDSFLGLSVVALGLVVWLGKEMFGKLRTSQEA